MTTTDPDAGQASRAGREHARASAARWVRDKNGSVATLKPRTATQSAKLNQSLAISVEDANVAVAASSVSPNYDIPVALSVACNDDAAPLDESTEHGCGLALRVHNLDGATTVGCLRLDQDPWIPIGIPQLNPTPFGATPNRC